MQICGRFLDHFVHFFVLEVFVLAIPTSKAQNGFRMMVKSSRTTRSSSNISLRSRSGRGDAKRVLTVAPLSQNRRTMSSLFVRAAGEVFYGCLCGSETYVAVCKRFIQGCRSPMQGECFRCAGERFYRKQHLRLGKRGFFERTPRLVVKVI